MATAGYSGTPLLKKLGISPGQKVLLIDAPVEYFEWLEEDITNQIVQSKETPDFIHLFVTSKKSFESVMKKLDKTAKKNTSLILWVSWYKKSAKMNTDITEDTIRNYALKNGWVDIKVCAVSELWSGLKLVIPRANRK
jgi:predicted ferric reductase